MNTLTYYYRELFTVVKYLMVQTTGPVAWFLDEYIFHNTFPACLQLWMNFLGEFIVLQEIKFLSHKVHSGWKPIHLTSVFEL